MELRGKVQNGVVVLEGNVKPAEGTLVRVLPVEEQKPGGSLRDALLRLAGTVEGPSDWAAQHDHDIHGTPKRP